MRLAPSLATVAVSAAVVALLPPLCAGLNVLLVQPAHARSFVLFQRRLAHYLTARGHSVVLLISLCVRDNCAAEHRPAGVDTLQLRLHYGDESGGDERGSLAFSERNATSLAAFYRSFARLWSGKCVELMTDYALQAEIARLKVDLVLGMPFDYCSAALAAAHRVAGHATIAAGDYVMPHAAYYMHALDQTPAYVPLYKTGYGDRMGWWQRAVNWWTVARRSVLHTRWDEGNLPGTSYTVEQELLARQPVELAAPMSEAVAATRSALLSGTAVLAVPRPHNSELLYYGALDAADVGDAHAAERRRRDDAEQLAAFYPALGNETRRFIVFSLGTNTNELEMGRHRMLAFLRAFGKLRDHVVFWKYGARVPEAERYPHVHMVDWLPQKALLRHRLTSLFITHGGHNSLMELIESGTPALLMPLFIDQYANAEHAVWLGVGARLDKMAVSERTVTAAMRGITGESAYGRRARRLSLMHADAVRMAQERLACTIRAIAKPHWRIAAMTSAKQLNFVQYFHVDLAFLSLRLLALAVVIMR